MEARRHENRQRSDDSGIQLKLHANRSNSVSNCNIPKNLFLKSLRNFMFNRDN